MIIAINNLSKILDINADDLLQYNIDCGLVTSEYMFSDLDEDWFGGLSRFNITLEYWDFLELLDLFFKNRAKKRKKSRKRKEKVKSNDDIVVQETSKNIRDTIYESFFIKRCGKFIIHVGPTSSGKTHNAVEAIKKSNGRCAFLSPLRLLAWEVYEKLSKTENGCDLITGEDYIRNGSNVVSSTIEMVDLKVNYDVVVIDESFMIGDKFRGKAWTKALFNLNAREIHLICNMECLEMIETLLQSTFKNYEVNRYDRKVPLEFAKEPSLLEELKPKTLVVVFSRKSVVKLTTILKEYGYNVSLLYGNLPPEVKKSQIQKFIDGVNDICVTTDVIGMGLNVPCDYVCFYQVEKFDGDKVRFLTPIEVRQIGGRSGRYGLSEKGTISATDQHMLKYVEEAYPIDQKIEYGFYGIEDWMIDHLKGNNMKEKLEFFTKLDFIPTEIESVLKKQSIENLLYVLNINKKINTFDYNLIWRLINLPISQINEEYFQYIVDKISVNEVIFPPDEIITEIICNDDLSDAESLCKKYELYLYAAKGDLCDYFSLHREEVMERKDKLIELIDNYISINTTKMLKNE